MEVLNYVEQKKLPRGGSWYVGTGAKFGGAHDTYAKDRSLHRSQSCCPYLRHCQGRRHCLRTNRKKESPVDPRKKIQRSEAEKEGPSQRHGESG